MRLPLLQARAACGLGQAGPWASMAPALQGAAGALRASLVTSLLMSRCAHVQNCVLRLCARHYDFNAGSFYALRPGCASCGCLDTTVRRTPRPWRCAATPALPASSGTLQHKSRISRVTGSHNCMQGRASPLPPRVSAARSTTRPPLALAPPTEASAATHAHQRIPHRHKCRSGRRQWTGHPRKRRPRIRRSSRRRGRCRAGRGRHYWQAAAGG